MDLQFDTYCCATFPADPFCQLWVPTTCLLAVFLKPLHQGTYCPAPHCRAGFPSLGAQDPSPGCLRGVWSGCVCGSSTVTVTRSFPPPPPPTVHADLTGHHDRTQISWTNAPDTCSKKTRGQAWKEVGLSSFTFSQISQTGCSPSHRGEGNVGFLQAL